MRPRLGILALAFLVATPALSDAESARIDCKLDFSLKGWAALYKTAHGDGTIACSNGEKVDVVLDAKGFGLSAGGSRLTIKRSQPSDAKGKE